jgi:hypothetical protein
MSRVILAAAFALAATLASVQAHAQSIRTFVSTTGSDTNPCSITEPCRHFSAAVAATSVGGEVDALEAGAYGSFAINQAITIEGQGWSYVAPPSGGAGITVTASSGVVNIRGVSLNGIDVNNATGILLTSSTTGITLNVQNSVIRNFSNFGIAFNPNNSGASQIFVSNTLVSDNGMVGISIEPFGPGTTTGVFEHVELENNGTNGLAVNTGTQTIDVTVSDSVSANNTNDGIFADSGSGLPASIMVRNSTIANNGSVGLQASGTGATIRVTRSTITGNNSGWAITASGVVSSYADNNIDGDKNTDTAPPAIGYK